MGFPERLKELRLAAKLTYKDMSERTGIGVQTCSSYEKGQSQPNLPALVTLAEFFGVPIGYLAGAEKNDVAAVATETVAADEAPQTLHEPRKPEPAAAEFNLKRFSKAVKILSMLHGTEKLDITLQTMKNYCAAEVVPNVYDIVKLAKHFGVSADELLGLKPLKIEVDLDD